MKSLSSFSLAVGLVLAAITVSSDHASARVEAGLLTCDVGEGYALIVSKPRDLHCVFHKANGQNEAYRGKLREIGLDVGVSGRGVIVWTVIAGTTELPPGELAGSYGGVEAGAAAVVGGRGEVLVGGANRTISLQPLSVEAEAGLNIAVGITSMELHPLFRGKPSASVRVPAVGLSHTVVPRARQEVHYGCGSYTHLQRGQTLSGLARTCGVTVESLLDANPQITNVRKIPAGTLVHLPSHVGHHGSSPCGDRAILQEGESLDHVAWRCGVTLHALLMENPDVREFSVLEPGLVLAVPGRSTPRMQAPVVWAKTEADVAPVREVRRRPQHVDATGTTAKNACLDAVADKTGRRNVRVLSYEFSQANSLVMVGVGAQRAPWRCLVSNDGNVAELSFEGSDGGAVTPAATEDAKVPGTNFNATGNLSCSRSAGQPMGQCKFGVVREGNGNGSITVFWPDGGSRVIFFEDGTPAYYDQAEADGGAKMTVGNNSGLYSVRIGSQRFEFAEAVITGG